MNVHISYKVARTPDIDREIQHWISKVQKRLQVFRPELVHLKGLIEQNSPREGNVVSLNLRLPSGQMAVQQSAASMTAAIKAAFDDLLAQVGKHKELLRNSHSWRRHRVLEGTPSPQVAFESTIAALPPQTATNEDVRSYVNANLRRLRLYVEREISFREDSGDLEPNSITWEEIVDEAVARALDERVEKPDKITLEPWLYHLAMQALNDIASPPANATAVDLQSQNQRRNGDAGDGHFQFYQPDETITAESAIADGRAWTPEQIAYSDEMVALVQFALGAARREDREAFILYAIEGFSLKEIASIAGRTPEQIRQSIQAARAALRRSLPVENPLKDELLQNTKSA